MQAGTKSIETDISKVPLYAFIQCVVHDNIAALGEGTEAEQRAAYEEILSQYYTAKDDQQMNEYIRLMKQAALSRMRIEIVGQLASICEQRYSAAAAEVLREYYPQMKFTEQTALQDIKNVRNGEISHRMRYDSTMQQIKHMDSAKGATKDITPAQKMKGVIITLMDISKIEGVRYDMATMTVLEFAIAENRLIEHIENLKNQANGR